MNTLMFLILSSILSFSITCLVMLILDKLLSLTKLNIKVQSILLLILSIITYVSLNEIIIRYL